MSAIKKALGAALVLLMSCAPPQADVQQRSAGPQCHFMRSVVWSEAYMAALTGCHAHFSGVGYCHERSIEAADLAEQCQ